MESVCLFVRLFKYKLDDRLPSSCHSCEWPRENLFHI